MRNFFLKLFLWIGQYWQFKVKSKDDDKEQKQSSSGDS